MSMWSALASDHRRRLLDALAAGPLTTGQLAAATPQLSRYAVMQHLGVLVDAGLVVVRRRGRERFNHLNAIPLQQAYERWVSPLAGSAAAELTALQRHLDRSPEQGAAMDTATDTPRTVRVENEINLAAPPARVFAAMTTEQGEWYPYTYGGERVLRIVCEARVGGQTYEDWGDGAGHLYNTISRWDPPAAVDYRGALGRGVSLEQSFTFEAIDDGAGTILRQHLVAFGPLTDDEVEGIRVHGDLTKVEAPLRRFLEG
jgi:DNA-binding transcriptional ArsR family regulator